MSTHVIFRLLVLAAAVSISFAFTADAPAQSKSATDAKQDRRHSQGPLTAADFKAAGPDIKNQGRGLSAVTTTDIKYDFQYTISKKRDKLVGQVESIQVFAVVLPAESWCKDPQDRALMDHEQGHFDLVQIEAFRAQVELTRRLEDEPLEAAGKKEIEVQQTLDREIRKLLRPYVETSSAANDDYDRRTAHGTLAPEQAAARKEHKEKLKKFAAADAP